MSDWADLTADEAENIAAHLWKVIDDHDCTVEGEHVLAALKGLHAAGVRVTGDVGLREAANAAQEALFDIYLHEGPGYGEGISVRPGGTIRDRINAANLAFAALRPPEPRA